MSTASQITDLVRERGTKQALWDDFCAAHDIAGTGVPLLAADRAAAALTHPCTRNRLMPREPALRAAG